MNESTKEKLSIHTNIHKRERRVCTYPIWSSNQAFGCDGVLYPKAKDAPYAFQCPSPTGFEDTDITSWKCTSGCCSKCGKLLVPCAEKDWMTSVNHHVFKMFPPKTN